MITLYEIKSQKSWSDAVRMKMRQSFTTKNRRELPAHFLTKFAMVLICWLNEKVHRDIRSTLTMIIGAPLGVQSCPKLIVAEQRKRQWTHLLILNKLSYCFQSLQEYRSTQAPWIQLSPTFIVHKVHEKISIDLKPINPGRPLTYCDLLITFVTSRSKNLQRES